MAKNKSKEVKIANRYSDKKSFFFTYNFFVVRRIHYLCNVGVLPKQIPKDHSNTVHIRNEHLGTYLIK